MAGHTNFLFFWALITSASVSAQGLIIGSGATVTASGGSFILGSNLTNDGNLKNPQGTFIFNGNDQAVAGSSVSSFNNIIVANGSITTLQSPQEAAGIVKVNGTLNSGGNLTLTSTEQGTASIDGTGSGQVAGDVTMQRYLPSGFGYGYVSSPFASATVSEFSDEIDLNAPFPLIYAFNENRFFDIYPLEPFYRYTNPTNLLTPLNGYAINFGAESSPLTIDLTGVLNNGSYSVELLNHNHPIAIGRHLIGNPYPSAIDWSSPSGWTKVNIDDALFYFRASDTDEWGGTYSSWIQGVSSDGVASNIIPAMQGFLVHVSDGPYPVSGSLSMDNSVRITGSGSYIKGSSGTPLIRFTAGFSDNTVSNDFAVVYFDSKATFEFDGQLDALKFMNTDENVPNLYYITPAGKNLSIYALPPVFNTFHEIPLGIKTYRDGNVVLKIRDIDPGFTNLRLTIKDIVTGVEKHLLPDSEFSVNLGAGEYRSRFFLNLSDIATGSGESSAEQEPFSIYYSHNTLYSTINIPAGTNSMLMISNLLGQTVLAEKISSQGRHELNVQLKDGIYIATLISGKSRNTAKFVIKN